MALDISTLGEFNFIFPAIFVFVCVYGLLVKVEFFKNQGWNAGIALALAMMTLTSSIAVKTITKAAPYLVLFMLLIIFIIFTYMVFGVKQDSISFVVRSEAYGYVKMIILFIVITIFAGSLASVLSEQQTFTGLTAGGNGTAVQASSTGGVPNEQTEFFRILFHPKILGMAVILLIMVFTIGRLAGANEKPH